MGPEGARSDAATSAAGRPSSSATSSLSSSLSSKCSPDSTMATAAVALGLAYEIGRLELRIGDAGRGAGAVVRATVACVSWLKPPSVQSLERRDRSESPNDAWATTANLLEDIWHALELQLQAQSPWDAEDNLVCPCTRRRLHPLRHSCCSPRCACSSPPSCRSATTEWAWSRSEESHRNHMPMPTV